MDIKEIKIELFCSTPKCGYSILELNDVYCEYCIKALKDEITELENKVYDLEKYIEKEEL